MHFSQTSKSTPSHEWMNFRRVDTFQSIKIWAEKIADIVNLFRVRLQMYQKHTNHFYIAVNIYLHKQFTYLQIHKYF